MSSPSSLPPATLDNCDREPIHIPGAIQAHGALIAFSPEGRVQWHSSNAALLVGAPISLEAPLDEGHNAFCAQITRMLNEALPDCQTGEQYSVSHELEAPQGKIDLVLNVSAAGVIAEFEPRESRDDVAGLALRAHRALDRLKRTTSIQHLLERAAEEIRGLTGFDRVMAYRFRHDDSGEIVAESKLEALESLLGRRYPASDIPAQARRLYVLSTLRLIVDVNATPIALIGQIGATPLDMSHAVLRSVSPIHIEYLRNMGVGASMSISIVIDGRLWGMFACHHMARHAVPYAVRMAVEVLAHVVATTIASLLSRQHEQRIRDALAVQTECAHAISDTDIAEPWARHLPRLADLLDADAALLISGGNLAHHGLTPGAATALAAFLTTLPVDDKPVWHRLEQWQGKRPEDLGDFCGLLAHCFDARARAWLVFLRKEQIETVRWGGKPEKIYSVGPNGPRLTPRGSFDEWRETVRDTSVPWTASDLEIASGWVDEMRRVTFVHQADTELARAHLIALLGHDLRDPLHAIKLAAHLLENTQAQYGGAAIGQRIQRSAVLMQRLISHVLDMTRLRSGVGLDLRHEALDLVALVRQVMKKRDFSQLDSCYELSLPEQAPLKGDPDRLGQVVASLLDNARRHGQPGTLVRVQVALTPERVVMAVRNVSPPIDEERFEQMLDPFKKLSAGKVQDASGLGLGLYITQQIARAHGGSLAYRYESPEVVFELELPRAR